MPRKTITALLAQVDSNLADNTTGNIAAADVRQMIKDVIESLAPGYGVLSADTLLLPLLGIVPKVVTYSHILSLTQEYTANLALGTLTRLSQGLPYTVTRVTFYADVAAPTGDELVFSLFRNGVDITGHTTISGQGMGNLAQAAFSVGNTCPDGANYTYDIRATKTTGGSDDVELSNVRFFLETVPTLGI